MAYINANLLIYTAVIMIIVLTGNIRSGYDDDRSTRIFHGMLVFDILMLISGGFDNYVLGVSYGITGSKIIHAILAGISDFSYFGVLGMFIIYIDVYAREAGYKINILARTGAIVSFVYGVFWFVSDFMDIIYVQNAEEIIHGPFYILGQVGGYLTGLLSICIVIMRWKSYTTGEKVGFTLFIFVPLLGSLLKGVFKGFTLMPLLVSLSIIIIQSFVQSARELLLKQQQAELARIQTNLFMSRIKPHFIYNVLNTIYALCDSSPEQAKDAIAKFSQYLRKSLIDIDSHRLIPFEDELKHVENYLAIEKLRFGDKLDISYEIEAGNFLIPPLTLQAVVENAVRHGIEKKPEGGRVEISSKEEDDAYVITVTDTGAGFDTDKVSLTHLTIDVGGRKHIGLYSAAHRLGNLCRGRLDIDSTPGKGTTVRITIGRGENR